MCFMIICGIILKNSPFFESRLQILSFQCPKPTQMRFSLTRLVIKLNIASPSTSSQPFTGLACVLDPSANDFRPLLWYILQQITLNFHLEYVTDSTIAKAIPTSTINTRARLEFIISFMSSRAISSLPQRNKGTYLDRCQKVNLLTNLFKVDFKDAAKVYIYAIKTTPEVHRENAKKLAGLVASVRNAIQKQVGSYVTSGRTIFATKMQGTGKEEITLRTEFQATAYQISLKMVKEVSFSEIFSPEKEKSAIVFTFLNNMIRNFFRQMKYTEIGRSRKFFDASSQKRLSGANVTVYKGFATNFSLLQSGLFFKADPIMKIIRSESVLEVINNVYKKNNSVSKTEKRMLVQEELIGKMVMANYGKNRCYIIDSILFDVALESYQFTHNDKCVNILEYYSHCYDIAVQAKRQPLLKARNNRKSKEKETEIILIPELCLMSGLPDDFDERKRREVSDYTITNAQAKFHEIQNVFKSLNNSENEYNPQTIGEKLGIKLSNTPQSITAKQIQYPELQLGDKQRVEENKTTNFMLFNKFLFSRDVTLKICIILPSDFDFGPTKRLLESTTSNIGLQYRSSMNTINYSDNKMAMKKIENIIQDESESKTSNIFWFIIPSNYKTQYKNLKRMTLKSGVEINSQVTVSSNLEKKGSASIFTKILLQMAAKVGNKLWVPRISPKIQNSGVMLIGIETTKDSQMRDKNIVSYCGNSSKDFSSFYSNFLYENKNELKTNMKEILFNTINEYISKCQTAPSEVFIIKNGTTKLDVNCYIQAEVTEIKELLKCISKSYDPIKLTYIILDKNSSQKFFIEKGRDIINPYSGTLVNSQAVGKCFEFYLIAQQCNRGSVKPTYYKVAYTDSAIEEGMIEELIYSQCFNYMNWTGSIKIPGMMQYAKKLGMFIGQYYNKETKFEQLSKNLYYI